MEILGNLCKAEDNGVGPSAQDAHSLQPLFLFSKFSLLIERAEGHCAPLSWRIQAGSQENFPQVPWGIGLEAEKVTSILRF